MMEQKRISESLNRAYNALYQNSGFKKALDATNGATLTHLIGKSKIQDTVLTASEFCSRLTYLRDRGKLPAKEPDKQLEIEVNG